MICLYKILLNSKYKEAHNMKRRMLAMLLVIVVMMSVLPVIASAENEGSCGRDLYWIYRPSDKVLTIRGTGPMYDFRGQGAAPWKKALDIQHIVIDEGVTSIGDYAFWDNPELLTVSIPEGITYIGKEAFGRCTGLTEVIMPDSVTRLGEKVFDGCTALENVKLSAGLEGLPNYAFYGCFRLKEIELPEGMVYLASYVFQNCPLTSINFPESLIQIVNATFSGCSLTELNLPANLYSLGSGTFYGNKFTQIDLPDGIRVLDESVFRACSELVHVDLPRRVEIIDENAFAQCAKLKNMVFPDNLKRLGNNAFQGCVELEYVCFTGDAPEFGAYVFPDKAITVYYPADNATWTEAVRQNYGGNLTWVPHTHEYVDWKCIFCGKPGPVDGTCGDGVRWIYEEETETLWIGGNGSVADYSGDEFQPWHGVKDIVSRLVVEGGVSGIGDNAFAEMENLVRVELADGLDRIGWGAFADCGKLERIVFQGDAPEMSADCFRGVRASAYYPVGYSHWESEVLQGYGGEISWICYTPDITRLSGMNRYHTGFAIADRLKEIMGVDQFDAVIVAYGQNFPDALTGSYLAAVKNAPILLTEPGTDFEVNHYIREHLVPGGKIYILGGSSAVSEAFENGVRSLGYDVKRLKGAGRYDTNLEILKEAGINATDEVLIATGSNYADSLSASATGLPMLLVDKELTASQRAFLEDTSKKFVILGGTGAVSAEIEAELDAIGDVTRVKGSNRYETSVAIARRYFSNPQAVVLAYAQSFPDGLCGGPLAISVGAPLILTSNESYGAADAYVQGISAGVVTGGTGRISDDAVREIFDLPGSAQIVKP